MLTNKTVNTNHVLICFLLTHCVLLLLLKYFLEQLSDFYIHFNVLLALTITGSYRDVLSKSLSHILEILPVSKAINPAKRTSSVSL